MNRVELEVLAPTTGGLTCVSTDDEILEPVGLNVRIVELLPPEPTAVSFTVVGLGTGRVSER